jgi:TIR domain
MADKLTIFISYRRWDSIGLAGRLHDHLTSHFGERNVFRDIDSLGPGVNFAAKLKEKLELCDVLIAVIGPGWLNASDEHGSRRLDNPEDYVRSEIVRALDRGITVVPVLVGGSRLPDPGDLPQTLSMYSFAGLNPNKDGPSDEVPRKSWTKA